MFVYVLFVLNKQIKHIIIKQTGKEGGFMLKEERLKRIIELLSKTGTIKVTDIMAELSISDMTVRRDLDELEKQGKLQRVHGGARLEEFYLHEELTHSEKTILNRDAKQKIAGKAAQLIEEGETIFIGPGTTCELLATKIHTKNLRIVTNCLPVFQTLMKEQKERKVYLLGGEMRTITQAFFGEITNKNLQDMHFHKVFFSCNGLNKQDVMTSTIEEGQTQRIALDNSISRYLLIDSSKIGKTDFAVYYQLQDITQVVVNKDDTHSYSKIEQDNLLLV